MTKKHSNYLAFERSEIPESDLLGRWRTGHTPEAWVNARAVNVFEQVRGGILPGELDDLTRTLVIGGEISIIQPPTIGAFTVAAAKRYLSGLNACWGTSHQYEETRRLPSTHPFAMAAVIAGHRRVSASVVVAEKDLGLEQEQGLWLPAQVTENPTFYQGLQTQFQENSHRQVPLWREAEAIAATVLMGRETGQLPTYAQVAAYLGVSEERVSNAVSFHALPEVIKDRVRAGNLTQESAINLERIGVALAMRELKNCIADDDYALLLKKYYALSLRVDELRPLLDTYGQTDDWESSLHAELTRLLAKEEPRKYVASRRSEVVGEGRLFELSLAEDADMRVTKMLRERTVIQGEALKALRILLAAMTADAERLDFAIHHPERTDKTTLMATPVIANSPRARSTWRALVEQMNTVAAAEADDSTVLIGLRAVTAGLQLLVAEVELGQAVTARSGEVLDLLSRLRSLFMAQGSGTSAGVGEELAASIAMLESAVAEHSTRQAEAALF